MKFLFDAMLSPKLAERLADVCPGSAHVADPGLERSDTAIWDFARENQFTIVTKDNDFHGRAEVIGPPPQVILIRLGNCRTNLIESLMRMSMPDIEDFSADPAAAILVLPLVVSHPA